MAAGGQRQRVLARIAWHVAEALIAVIAGVVAGSIALVGFGADLLAHAKRHVGRQLNSSATVKEASQTSLCAYLSVALLIGLGTNTRFGWWWADPLAALAIAAVAAKEGRESRRGEGCADGC